MDSLSQRVCSFFPPLGIFILTAIFASIFHSNNYEIRMSVYDCHASSSLFLSFPSFLVKKDNLLYLHLWLLKLIWPGGWGGKHFFLSLFMPIYNLLFVDADLIGTFPPHLPLLFTIKAHYFLQWATEQNTSHFCHYHGNFCEVKKPSHFPLASYVLLVTTVNSVSLKMYSEQTQCPNRNPTRAVVE